MLKLVMIINAFTPRQIDLSMLSFIAENNNNIMLTGAFFEDAYDFKLYETEMISEPVSGNSFGTAGTFPRKELQERAEENIETFKMACRRLNIPFNIKRERGVAISEMIYESRFADLILVDPELSFSPSGYAMNQLAHDFLQRAECPVLVLPSHFHGIKRIAFAYNGSPSSVFAIKQLVYLLPQITNYPLHLIYSSQEYDLPERKAITDWINGHFKKVTYQSTPLAISNVLLEEYEKDEQMLIVMGAFGRSRFSRWFNPSKGHKVVNLINTPVFIAHR